MESEDDGAVSIIRSGMIRRSGSSASGGSRAAIPKRHIRKARIPASRTLQPIADASSANEVGRCASKPKLRILARIA